jgi:hypothetical protein
VTKEIHLQNEWKVEAIGARASQERLPQHVLVDLEVCAQLTAEFFDAP